MWSHLRGVSWVGRRMWSRRLQLPRAPRPYARSLAVPAEPGARRRRDDAVAPISSMALKRSSVRFRLAPSTPPVENVIVGEYAAIDPCGREAVRVLRAHPVIDSF